MLLACITAVSALGNAVASASQPANQTANQTETRAVPTPDQAVRAYQRAETLLATGGVEDLGTACAPFGAYIALRTDGVLVAQGADAQGGPDSVRRAALEVLNQIDERMEPDATEEQRAELLATLMRSRVTMELQLAGAWHGVGAAELQRPALAPGLSGVGVTLGARPLRWAVFPSQMIAAGIDQADAARGLVATARGGGDPTETLEQALTGAKCYLFEVVELASLTPGQPPTFLRRGQKLVPIADITSDRLRAILTACADRILPLAGAESPDELVNTPATLAGVALALARAASVVDDPAQRLGYQAAARQIAGSAQALAPNDAAVGALVIATSRALGPEAADQTQLAPARRALLGPAAARENESATQRGLRAFGLSELAVMSGEEADRKAARLALSGLYTSTGPGGLLSAQPWATWAELTTSDLEGQPSPAAGALRELRALCWASQLTPEQAGPAQPDLAGGFKLAGSPWPTWQSLRPMAALAAMAADPTLTEPDERTGEVLRLLDALRFLDQLVIDKAVVWRVERPRALGGVRASVWANNTPLDAQSLAILTLAQTLESFERIGATGGVTAGAENAP